MAQEKMDATIDLMEQELEMVKEQLQRIPVIERTLEQMVQNLAQSLGSMEDTQRLVMTMFGQKGTPDDRGGGEDTMGKGSEGFAQIKEKILEHLGVVKAGPSGRTGGPSMVGGD